MLIPIMLGRDMVTCSFKCCTTIEPSSKNWKSRKKGDANALRQSSSLVTMNVLKCLRMDSILKKEHFLHKDHIEYFLILTTHILPYRLLTVSFIQSTKRWSPAREACRLISVQKSTHSWSTLWRVIYLSDGKSMVWSRTEVVRQEF